MVCDYYLEVLEQGLVDVFVYCSHLHLLSEDRHDYLQEYFFLQFKVAVVGMDQLVVDVKLSL